MLPLGYQLLCYESLEQSLIKKKIKWKYGIIGKNRKDSCIETSHNKIRLNI